MNLQSLLYYKIRNSDIAYCIMFFIINFRFYKTFNAYNLLLLSFLAK